MSITIRNPIQAGTFICVVETLHTAVDRFQFADNVQANLRELVFQEMKE